LHARSMSRWGGGLTKTKVTGTRKMMFPKAGEVAEWPNAAVC